MSFINPVKNAVYKGFSKRLAAKDPENKRKIDLFDAEQNKIKNAPKEQRKGLQKNFNHLLQTNKDLHFGKGVRELSSIGSTVFILALCAPILSQIILHPVMDLIFKNDKKNKQTPNTQAPTAIAQDAPQKTLANA